MNLRSVNGREVVPMAADGENANKGEKLKSGIPSFSFGYDSGKGVLFQICFELKICSLHDFEPSGVCFVDISKS